MKTPALVASTVLIYSLVVVVVITVLIYSLVASTVLIYSLVVVVVITVLIYTPLVSRVLIYSLVVCTVLIYSVVASTVLEQANKQIKKFVPGVMIAAWLEIFVRGVGDCRSG